MCYLLQSFPPGVEDNASVMQWPDAPHTEIHNLHTMDREGRTLTSVSCRYFPLQDVKPRTIRRAAQSWGGGGGGWASPSSLWARLTLWQCLQNTVLGVVETERGETHKEKARSPPHTPCSNPGAKTHTQIFYCGAERQVAKQRQKHKEEKIEKRSSYSIWGARRGSQALQTRSISRP